MIPINAPNHIIGRPQQVGVQLNNSLPKVPDSIRQNYSFIEIRKKILINHKNYLNKHEIDFVLKKGPAIFKMDGYKTTKFLQLKNEVNLGFK